MAALEVILSLVDQFSSGMDSATESVDNFKSSVDSADSGMSGLSGMSFDEIQSSAEAAGISVDSINEAMAHTNTSISGFDSSPIKETGEASSQAGEEMGFLGIMASAIPEIFAAIAAIGLGAILWEAASLAGNVADQWLRISVAMGGTANDVNLMQETWGAAIEQMRSDTGRKAGDIRNFIRLMGIAGLETQSEVIASFDAIAGASFILDRDITSLSETYQSMIMMPNRVAIGLRQLGISEEDLRKITGMSREEFTKYFKTLDVDGRAALLNQILNTKYGADANEAYKVSWQHLNDALQAAWDLLVRLVGEIILPFLIPAIEAATNVLNFFTTEWKKLVSGDFSSFFMKILGFLDTFGLFLWPIIWPLIIMGNVVIGLSAAWAGWSKEIVQFKNNIMSGNWIGAAQQIYSAFVWVGQSIWNWFANLPAWLGTTATAWINYAGDIVDWIIIGLKEVVSVLAGFISASMVGDALKSGMENATIEAGRGGGVSLARNYVEGFIKWVQDNWPQIKDILFRLITELAPLLFQAIVLIIQIVGPMAFQAALQLGWWIIKGILTFIWNLPGMLLSALYSGIVWVIFSLIPSVFGAAYNLGVNIYNGVKNAIAGLAGLVAAEFWRLVGVISSFVGQAFANAYAVGAGIVAGVKAAAGFSSPGHIYRMFKAEMERVNKLLTGSSSVLGGAGFNMGSGVVNAFAESRNTSNITITHDFRNVPSHIDTNQLGAILKSGDLDSSLERTLSRMKLSTKHNLGV
jgi:hypothetical protein